MTVNSSAVLDYEVQDLVNYLRQTDKRVIMNMIPMESFLECSIKSLWSKMENEKDIINCHRGHHCVKIFIGGA